MLEICKCELIDKVDKVFESMPGQLLPCVIATLDSAVEEKLTGKRVMETVAWEPGCKVPDGMGKFPVVLANRVLRKQRNIREAIRSISAILEDGGFMIVHETTKNFHLMLPIDGAFQKQQQTCEDYESDKISGLGCSAEKWREMFAAEGFDVVYERSDNILSSLFLVRKSRDNSVEKQTFIEISDISCSWLDELKCQLEITSRKPNGENLWLQADGSISGIMGLVNTHRQEPGGDKLRMIFNMHGSGIHFDRTTIERLVRQDLVTNVYKQGQWGCYRHLPLEKEALVPSQHAYVNTEKTGDLSSLTWYQSPLRHDRSVIPGTQEICDVHYAPLNFRDVMLATGKLVMDSIPGFEYNMDCLLGMEFSGTDSSGKRVMGLVPAKGLATTVKVHPNFLWPVPDTWTLEEAATVPVVYTTAYYALVVRANISPRNTILIHSGSGGVGQAAITVALHYGCRVFTTVGTEEKRKFLKDKFPALNDECIFSSRDTAFETGIIKATRGKGVDIVLNSLAEDKLFASVRVVAKHGKFLEIGKFDLAKNSALGMSVFLKNITFHGILTDALFDAENGELQAVSRCLMSGIEAGVVKPLNTTVFDTDEVEEAFRYMAKGKHIGKVLIKVRGTADSLSVPAIPKTSFYPDKTYVITGGLGGFGLELADWMVNRGAQHLVLTSRSGVKTGYQSKKLHYLRSRGVDISVSSKNICIKDEVCQLFQQANRPVGGVFHLAMVLKDGLLVNQTAETFKSVCDPKVLGTINLDEVTRKLDSLDFFVGFSSTACGYGNAGQANYSFANSVLERVIEKRREDGFPGLSIQWGPIGDVGVFVNQIGDNDLVMGGTKPQRIASSLQSLDVFLNQPEPIVCSYVLADQKSSSLNHADKNIMDAVCNILGIKDHSALDENKTLGDLGLDSLMTAEIKGLLENEFAVSLGNKEIRELTLKKMKSIEKVGKEHAVDERQEILTEALKESKAEDLVKFVPKDILVKLNDVETGTPLFVVHHLIGYVYNLRELASHLKCPVYGLQRTEEVPQDCVEAVSQCYIKAIENVCGRDVPLCLAGLSFGALVAQEMALQLQACGREVKTLILLDGSSEWVKKNLTHAEVISIGYVGARESGSSVTVENHGKEVSDMKGQRLNVPLLQLLHKDHKVEEMTEESYVSGLLALVPNSSVEEAKLSYQLTSNSMKMGLKYTPASIYNNDTLLLAAEESMGLPYSTPDYGLHTFCPNKLTVEIVAGSHFNFILGEKAFSLAKIINSRISRI